MTKPARDSSIELYRIIVMLAIVAHHYVVNSGFLICVIAIFALCAIIDPLRPRFIEKPLFAKALRKQKDINRYAV